MQQPDTGVITVATGSGFTFDGLGNPTGGTVTGFSMSLNGTVQTTITDISWNLVAFITALDEIDQNENYVPMGALFSASPIVVDASTATGGFDFSDIADLSPYITATITITGSSHDDTLMGGAANDTINAGANDGFDLIGGSGGNDVYDFGDADFNSYYTLTYEMQTGPIVVTLDGVAGQGTVTGSGTDTLTNINAAMTASDGGLAIVGTGSNDTFNVTTTGTQWASVVGGAGNDTFNLTLGSGMRVDFRSIVEMGATQGLIMDLSTGVVSNDGFGGTDQINVTGSGRLEIRATNNTDQITGSSRNESFILELGNDTLDAGAGFDRLRYDRNGVEYVTVDLSTGLISGVWYGSAFIHTVSGVEWVRGSRTGNDQLIGDGNANRLEGMGGNDTLNGMDGNDTLDGGLDNDLLDGGLGDDSLFGSWGTDTLYGGAGADLLDSGEGNDINWGGAGNDTLFAGEGNDLLGGGDGNDELWGGTGNDTFYAGAGDDTLGGGDGNDELWTGAGNNTVYAGAGDDTLGGADGNDELWGGEGNNDFYGGGGADTMGGGSGDDEMWAGSGWDVVYGGAGNDTVAGGIGNDELWAGAGTDLLFGDAGDDTLSGADDNDTIWAGTGNDLIYGGTGNDQMSGGADNDTIWAGLGNDVLWGDAGNDRLYGVGGDDTLIGHAGNDTMTGGGGADRFVFRTGFGNDVATDFSLAQSDELALDDALWASYGTLTAAQVIAQFGSVSGGNVVFTFDGGEVITLNGLGSLAGLDSHIVII